MFSRFSKITILFILASVLVLPNFILGQENLSEICQLEKIEQQCKIIASAECRKLLEKCEKYYQEESARIEKDITKTAQEKKTLQNKISSLSKKIKNLEYQINQSNVVIKDLKIQIGDTTGSIEKTSLKIEDLKEKLSNILRTFYEEDQKPIIEILFAEDRISDFFDSLMALETLNYKNKELLQNIKILKSNLEQQKVSLDEEKGGLEKMVKIQTLQKQENAETKGEQEYYLNLTEKEYQKQLKEKQEIAKKAAEIRARIFELVGVPKAPTFGEAYEIAKYVAGITGVRPAFLLAVLQQESAIGKNVGQCYLTNINTGDGIRVSNNAFAPKTMSPTRDVPHFLTITKELGRDPLKTLVSCQIPSVGGWGGAMGPAQFIPSTWMLYKDRLQGIIGKPGNPWNIQDAFLASGLYLSDYGAKSRTKDGEWRAAMIYFSGSTNPQFSWYADSVLKIAAGFETDIAILEQSR